MAGDWIKIRTDLADDPDVFILSEELSVDCPTIVGHLVTFWGWMNRHTSDGSGLNLSAAIIDKKVGAPGFTSAMVKIGWLDGDDHAYFIPNFDRHNGNTAKARALESEAKRLRRLDDPGVSEDGAGKPKKAVREMSDKCRTSVGQKTPKMSDQRREEKRREDNKNTFVHGKPQTSASGESESDQSGLFEEQNTTPTDQPNGEAAEPENHSSETAAKIPPCPHLAIIDAYHRILPECPGVLVDLWPNTPRAKNLQARWRESPKHQSVEFWEWYFTEVRTLRNGFYIDPSEGGPWVANLEWLVNRSNFVKLVEQIAQRGRAA